MPTQAKIICDSITVSGQRLTTFEVELPKVLLAENNTHREFSRNYSSSRAIPASSFVEIEMFEPVQWLQNQAGMQAKSVEISDVEGAKKVWHDAIEYCKGAALKLNKDYGLHKQWSNRLIDWCVMARGVVSSTQMENFYWLRDAEDAQPEMERLARSMKEAQAKSNPTLIYEGQWHLPYVKTINDALGQTYFDDSGNEISLLEAQMISASCCAQASYRKNDPSLGKAEDIFDKLIIKSSKPHMSPFEHQATPITEDNWTHTYRDGSRWCGNFNGWSQFRHFGVPEIMAIRKNVCN